MRTITNDINENRTGRTTTSDIAIDERVEVWRGREGRGVNGGKGWKKGGRGERERKRERVRE